MIARRRKRRRSATSQPHRRRANADVAVRSAQRAPSWKKGRLQQPLRPLFGEIAAPALGERSGGRERERRETNTDARASEGEHPRVSSRTERAEFAFESEELEGRQTESGRKLTDH